MYFIHLPIKKLEAYEPPTGGKINSLIIYTPLADLQV